jgi:hypothetical protein
MTNNCKRILWEAKMIKRLMMIVTIAIIVFIQPERSANAINMDKAVVLVKHEEVRTEAGIQLLAVKPSATKSKAVIKKQVLVNQKGVKITALNLVDEKAYSNMRLNVMVESKNKDFMDIYVEDTSVNGFMYQGGRVNYFIASEGMKEESCINISKDFLEENGIKTIQTIEFKLVAYSSETKAVIFETDMITIKTTTKDKTKQAVDASGERIYNAKGVKIISKGWDTSSTSSELRNNLYIENNSKEKVFISFTPTRSILGEDSNLTCSVMPGKKLNTYLTFDENAISGADHVTIGFIIYEKNLTGKQIDKVDSVTLPGNAEEASIDNKKEATINTDSIEEQVIYDKGGVKVTALSLKGTTASFAGRSLQLLIENYSKSYIVLSANDISYNDFMAEEASSGSFHIKPGEVRKGIILIHTRDIEHSGFARIATMGFNLTLYQNGKSFESDYITIDTTAKKEQPLKFVPSGEAFYDNKNIKIVYLGQENTSSYGPVCNFYIENNSDTELFVDVRPKPSIIREDAEDCFSVMPDKKAYYVMMMDKESIKSKPKVMIGFAIYDNNRKLITETEPVKLPLDK